ncbi:MAG TPA: alpha/beta hydrolase [Alphaproteobacteria bacterium]
MAAICRERFFAATNNLSLFFKDWGDPLWPATPVLCLPGLARNSKDFDRLAQRLADPDGARPRRVIAPDLRGRGRSARDPDWRNYRARTYLDDIRHLLAILGLDRVIVIGTSMGGLLGMAMATAMPTMLRGLVVNDIGPEVDPRGAGRILSYVAADHPQPDWASATAHLRRMLPNLSLATADEWLTFAQATFRLGDDGQLHFDWDANLVKPLRDDMDEAIDLWGVWRATRRVPTLVIRGGLSDILSAATLARMKAERPDLWDVTLPNVGHAPTLDEPLARKVLDEFLDRF